MTYPVNASDTYKNQIRAIGYGSNTVTVGDGGMYATLKDAIDYITTLSASNLETLDTGSFTLVNGASVLTASAAIDAGVQGRDCYLQIDGEDWLFPFNVTDPGSSTVFKLRYPLYGRTEAATDFSVISPKQRYTVILLPGRHQGDGNPVIVPPFTSIVGYGKGVTFYEDQPYAATRGLIEIPSASQNVEIRGFSMMTYGSNRGASILLTESGSDVLNTGQRLIFDGLDVASTEASEDGIWKGSTSKNVVDDILIQNCDFEGYYDSIAIFQTIRTRILNNQIFSLASVNDVGPAQCVNIGCNSLTNAYTLITGNKFKTYQGQTSFGAGNNACVISTQLNTTFDFIAKIDNNIFIHGFDLNM